MQGYDEKMQSYRKALRVLIDKHLIAKKGMFCACAARTADHAHVGSPALLHVVGITSFRLVGDRLLHSHGLRSAI